RVRPARRGRSRGGADAARHDRPSASGARRAAARDRARLSRRSDRHAGGDDLHPGAEATDGHPLEPPRRREDRGDSGLNRARVTLEHAGPRPEKPLAPSARGTHDLVMWRRRKEGLDPSEILTGIAQMVMRVDAKLDHIVNLLRGDDAEEEMDS